MRDWFDIDIDKTVKTFDYTNLAVQKMNRLIDSRMFENVNPKAVYNYLLEDTDRISFQDYLKRYIYEHAEIKEPFSSISDEVYTEILKDSFYENAVPAAVGVKYRKNNAIFKSWITQSSIRRSTFFLIAFGLHMAVEDVSIFLMKVLKEEDFDFYDPEEVIIWYCLKRGQSYLKAQNLMEQYKSLEAERKEADQWKLMTEAPALYLLTEKNLKVYLSGLKYDLHNNEADSRAYRYFCDLYEQCRSIIASTYNQDTQAYANKKHFRSEDIKSSDVEKHICIGIPYNENGNLKAMSASKLAKTFQYKRMSRQRIHAVLEKKQKAERFDLITLLFFIYANTVEPDWPAERYLKYVEKINHILKECNMMEIYPVNPYEAFILLCLISDNPMETFAEVWQISYN